MSREATQRRARRTILAGLALLSLVAFTQGVFWILDNTIAGDYTLEVISSNQ